jgi:hypothetical protein
MRKTLAAVLGIHLAYPQTSTTKCLGFAAASMSVVRVRFVHFFFNIIPAQFQCLLDKPRDATIYFEHGTHHHPHQHLQQRSEQHINQYKTTNQHNKLTDNK